MLLGGWLYQDFFVSFCLWISNTESEFNQDVAEASGRESVELACVKVYPSSLK